MRSRLTLMLVAANTAGKFVCSTARAIGGVRVRYEPEHQRRLFLDRPFRKRARCDWFWRHGWSPLSRLTPAQPAVVPLSPGQPSLVRDSPLRAPSLVQDRLDLAAVKVLT